MGKNPINSLYAVHKEYGIAEAELLKSATLVSLLNQYNGKFIKLDSSKQQHGAYFSRENNTISINIDDFPHTDTVTNQPKYDFSTILAHELGHAVGQFQAEKTKNYQSAQAYSDARRTGEGEAIFYEYQTGVEIQTSNNPYSRATYIFEKNQTTSTPTGDFAVTANNKFVIGFDAQGNSILNTKSLQTMIGATSVLTKDLAEEIGKLNYDMMASTSSKTKPQILTYDDRDKMYFILDQIPEFKDEYYETVGKNFLDEEGDYVNYIQVKSLVNRYNNHYNASANIKADIRDVLQNQNAGGSALAKAYKDYDLLYGGRGNDLIKGNSGKDILIGGKGDDTLLGGSGHDILGGNEGDDILVGNAGVDIMIGGIGMDSYRIQDRDTVIDSDGLGKIVFARGFGRSNIQAAQFKSSFAQGLNDNSWIGVDEKGQFNGLFAVRELNGLRISVDAHTVFVDDFFANGIKQTPNGNWSALSMELERTQSVDIRAKVARGGADKHTVFHFTHGYTETLPETASQFDHEQKRMAQAVVHSGSSKDDMLLNSSNGGAVVYFDGGNDIAYGGYGYDWLYGEAGNDFLYGSPLGIRPNIIAQNEAGTPEHFLDRDYLVGGAGSDFIYGVDGNDVIFTDEDGTRGTTVGHLVQESAESAKRGDWAAGGKGDDLIYGSFARDFLTGGEGSDTIYGGAGNDVIIGDGQILANIKRSLNVAAQEINQDGKLSTTVMGRMQHLDFDMNKDDLDKYPNNQNAWDFDIRISEAMAFYSIQAAVGKRFDEHRVKTGGAADFLYGGEGNDLIIGQDGNDVLDGGKGNDFLLGNDYDDTGIATSDNDILYGREGDDYLYGGIGNDMLCAGTGNDFLYGGKGFDTYLFERGDLLKKGEKNIIVDEDGSGEIVINGVAVHTLNWVADTQNANHWTAGDKLQWNILLDGSDLILSYEQSFNAEIIVKQFTGTSLGFNLFTENKTYDAFKSVNENEVDETYSIDIPLNTQLEITEYMVI